MFTLLPSPFRSMLLLALVALLLLNPTLHAAPQRFTASGSTIRVSVSSTGAQANGKSVDPALSGDGRYVAFSVGASNLVSGDTNGMTDIFVHDTLTGSTARVSVSSTGTQANGGSGLSSLSDDGRYIAFGSIASNLVSGDTNNSWDVFVHDTLTGSTTRVSVSSTGAQANAASSDLALSGDGRYVAFGSDASNLVSGDTNGRGDIFLHDTLTGSTTRVSVSSTGAQANASSDGPALSGDGRYIAFRSGASNLVSGDTNGQYDVFLHDALTGSTTRVSVSSTGAQTNGESRNPALSGDGRYIVFGSGSDNLVSGDTNTSVDVFLHDTLTGSTARVSVSSTGTQANGGSDLSSLSDDGRYIAFGSRASNLVSGDTNNTWDVFVHDTLTASTTRVSVSSTGAQANHDSIDSELSGDGRYVVFESWASNLVSGDTNNAPDVFLTNGWPLAVRLTAFSATPEARTIRVQWETEDELDNLGFNLYRGIAQQAPDTQLNSQIIPAQAPGSSSGAAYEWIDSSVQARITYYYWLEDVDTNGYTTLHGPVEARLDAPTAITLSLLQAQPSRALPLGVLVLLGLVVVALFWRARTAYTLPH